MGTVNHEFILSYMVYYFRVEDGLKAEGLGRDIRYVEAQTEFGFRVKSMVNVYAAFRLVTRGV